MIFSPELLRCGGSRFVAVTTPYCPAMMAFRLVPYRDWNAARFDTTSTLAPGARRVTLLPVKSKMMPSVKRTPVKSRVCVALIFSSSTYSKSSFTYVLFLGQVGRMVHHLGDAQVLLRGRRVAGGGQGADQVVFHVQQLHRVAPHRKMSAVVAFDEKCLSAGWTGRPGAEGDDVGRDVERAAGGDDRAVFEREIDAAAELPARDVDRHAIGIDERQVLLVLIARDWVGVVAAESD